MILTYEIFESAKSINGGYSDMQLAILGIIRKNNKGWKSEAIGVDFHEITIQRFVLAADRSKAAYLLREEKLDQRRNSHNSRPEYVMVNSICLKKIKHLKNPNNPYAK